MDAVAASQSSIIQKYNTESYIAAPMLYDITTLGDPGVVYPNASSPDYWYYGVYKPDGNGGYTLDNPFGNPLPKVEGPFDYDLEDGDLVIWILYPSQDYSIYDTLFPATIPAPA